MDTPLEMFLSGLTLGVGPCMLFCLPILLPVVAGTKEGLLESVKATLAFSLSRLLAYTLLGLVSGFSGGLLIRYIGQFSFSFYIWILGGFFVSLMGVLILVGGDLKSTPCKSLIKYTIDDGLKSLAFLGFIVGITPCAPLLGILTYLTLSAKTPIAGAFYALCFGLGASITTPITLLGFISGVAPRLVFKTQKIYEAFKMCCGLILILLGTKEILSQIISLSQLR